jgi:hypothetical protein
MSTKKLGTYATKEEFLEHEVRSLNHHIVSMIDTMKVMSMNRQHMSDEIERLKLEVEAAVLAERKACANIADSQLFNTNALLTAPLQSSAAYQIGVSIRARGKA